MIVYEGKANVTKTNFCTFILSILFCPTCKIYSSTLMNTVSYDNKKFRLVSAAIASIYIVFHGIPVDLVKAFSSPGFYVAVVVSFSISLILVQIIHQITIMIDGRSSWRERPFERAVLQFIFGVVFPALVDLVLITVYFTLLGQNIVDNGFLLIDFPVIVCLIIFFNLYYVIRYLLLTENNRFSSTKLGIDGDENQMLGQTRSELTSMETATLTIHYNGKHIYFNVQQDILCFHRDGRKVIAMTVNGNHYPINIPISELGNRYENDGLCRINRATIINFKLIKGYLAGKSRGTAELIIQPIFLPLIEGLDTDKLIVTKEYLNSFKERIEKLALQA